MEKVSIRAQDLDDLRLWQGFTWLEFAESLGVHVTTLWRWRDADAVPPGPALVLLGRLRDQMQKEAGA